MAVTEHLSGLGSEQKAPLKHNAKTLPKRSFTTRRKRLEQDLEHVTQEMYVKNLELVSTNTTLSLLRAIDTIVLESQDSLQQLSTQVSKAILKNSSFASVAIFTKSPHANSVELAGFANRHKNHQLSQPLVFEVGRGWLKHTANAVLVTITEAELEKTAKQLGYSFSTLDKLSHIMKSDSCYLIKLRARKKLVGLMAVGFSGTLSRLPEKDSLLIDRLSEAVGVAVDSRLLYEENQRVLKQLKKTNEKLRALDEAKDEFISMASHQLRTPLTSIKGYLSMMVEGDLGKLTVAQKKALKEAFGSSQRMVFLIADFLNVSRIKTGKFVIEPKKVDLISVVSEELNQLNEMASAKDITFMYEPPAEFPAVMLDDNKIRQVMMNMVDNAIYYTPSGGTITIQLYHTAEEIIFKVIDTGIGVPKAEQHKLFTKFFRAGNARKARPDGTGLGLFMAQKIVVEQGGAIIFESTEGKGSTFGFRFPLTKIRA